MALVDVSPSELSITSCVPDIRVVIFCAAVSSAPITSDSSEPWVMISVPPVEKTTSRTSVQKGSLFTSGTASSENRIIERGEYSGIQSWARQLYARDILRTPNVRGHVRLST